MNDRLAKAEAVSHEVLELPPNEPKTSMRNQSLLGVPPKSFRLYISLFLSATKTQSLISSAGLLLASSLTGLSQPVITAQPQNQTNVAGTTATFTVQATGTPPLFYQWRSYTSTTLFTNIPGATEASLVLTNVQPTTQRFAVVVSNAEGAVTSVLARLVVVFPPMITGQPTHRAVEAGLSATLSVTASGTAPLAYQWYFNGAVLPGQTSSNLVLANVQLANAGHYTVVVTNLFGAVTSQVARLIFPGPHGFSAITSLEDGRILLSLTGGVAARFWPYFDLYPVEASTNLIDWTHLVWLLRTNQPPNDLLYLDLEARGLDQRFYRTFTNHLITPELPPTGPYAVGVTTRVVTDPSRTNRYGIATNSSFMISVWYPAERAVGVPPAAYFDKPIAERCDFWNSQYVSMGCGFTNVAPRLVSSAVPEVPAAGNNRPFPVIVYSHGGTLLRADNIDKAQDLASHGFVVVAPDHLDAFMSVFPDNTTVFGQVTVNQLLSNPDFYVESRLRDVDVVLDELEGLNQTDPLLSGTMDLANVGAMGWSLGGATAAQTSRTNAQVKAAVLLDASAWAGDLTLFGLQEPFLTMTTTNGNWQSNQALYNLSTNHPVYLEIQGTDHFTFSMLAWLRSPTPASRRAALTISACSVSFFKRYLKNEDDGFLNVATNLYPEIVNFQTK